MFQGVLNSINKGIKNIMGATPNKYIVKGKEYNEVCLLGEGGFGYVYEVEDAITGEKFALKKINITDKLVLENIKREIDVWKKINNSPNIVKLIDYEFTNQFVSILMELSSEGNLFKLITNDDKHFSEKEVLQIVFEAAKGIAAMHSQNPPVAHRDIKIENILKKGNTYKLCDFGSSTTRPIDPKKDDKAFVLEQFSAFDKYTTFMYRPPEMCDQYCKYLINEKVDVWMLGCVMYAVMFKKHPFQDAQKLAIINAHYYIPDEEAEKYSEKCLDFMRVMLTPNPSLRPSIFDVLNTLKGWSGLNSIPLSDEVREIKAKQLKNKKTKKLDFLTPEDILRVQEQIKKDQMKKRRYIKNDDDIDDVIASADNDDIGEAKYSNIVSNNKNAVPQNNQNGNFNIGNGNTNEFNNLANNFSNQNNKVPANSNTNIWDFDFGAASSNTNLNNNDKKANMDYSDFQFFNNNNNTNSSKASKNEFENIFANNQPSNTKNTTANGNNNNFGFDFNNLNISSNTNNNQASNNFGFDFNFNNNQKQVSNNSVSSNNTKSMFDFDFSSQNTINNNHQNLNLNSKPAQQPQASVTANNKPNPIANNNNLGNQNIYDFFK